MALLFTTIIVLYNSAEATFNEFWTFLDDESKDLVMYFILARLYC